MTRTYIFAEGSNTTADDPELPLKEYYEGLFSTVVKLYDELDEISDVRLLILSEEYGVGDGTHSLNSAREGKETPVGFEEMKKVARKELLDAATDADVMVILLSTRTFDAVVGENWADIADAAEPDSIWCLGAARSSLESLNLNRLEKKGCTVFTYQRRGVARLGQETRDELLNAVKQRDTQ